MSSWLKITRDGVSGLINAEEILHIKQGTGDLKVEITTLGGIKYYADETFDEVMKLLGMKISPREEPLRLN